MAEMPVVLFATTGRSWWRDWRGDVAVAATIGAVQLGGTYGAATNHFHESIPPFGWLALAGSAIVLLFRRRYPVAVLWSVIGLTLWYQAEPWPRGPIYFSLIAAFATAVIAGRRRAAVASLIVGYVTFQWVPALVGTEASPSVFESLGLAAWLLVLFVGAEWIRARRQRAEALTHSLEEESRRRATEERLRIARELHDVLAHDLSLINVQAGTALHLADRQPERALDALATIKEVSKEALVELRAVLGALRSVDEGVPRAPAPSLNRLADLVTRAGSAGVTVHLDRIGPTEPLPSPVDQAAFRIIQEALTNVARHSGATTAVVRVTREDRAVVVEVDDDGRANPSAAGPHGNGSVHAGGGNGGGGNGIAGMRERARALGGNLQAGPRHEGGFRVRAWLPVPDR
jgi:signal transduction histidine kinase